MIAAIAHLHQGNFDCRNIISLHGATTSPFIPSHSSSFSLLRVGRTSDIWGRKESNSGKIWSNNQKLWREKTVIPKSSGSSNSNGTVNESSSQDKTPFGYTRKDVLLIGLGVTAFGYALKTGLEFVGVDPLQAGNVVQLVIVLGMTIGWISTYMFRVANKDMTYAQQLRDYESKVMEKRLEGLTEAEVQALIEQVEEEKRRLANTDQVN